MNKRELLNVSVNRENASIGKSNKKRKTVNVSAALPIAIYRHDIVNSVKSHCTTVIIGETGSG